MEDKQSLILKVERIDGVEYEIGTDAHRAAVTRSDESTKLRKGELDALQAKYDSAADKVKTLEEANKALNDPARLDAAAAARASLIEIGRKVCGAETKFDGKSDVAIRREIVAKGKPNLRLDGKSDEYVQGLFDDVATDASKAAERADAEKAGKSALANALVIAPLKQDATEVTRIDVNDEWEKMVERNRNAWKKPANGTAKGA